MTPMLTRTETSVGANITELSDFGAFGEKVEQNGLEFEIDGEGDAVTIDEDGAVGYVATATFEDGSTPPTLRTM